ncbi:MAG: hypothetical protein C0467_13100 [Planctomycetaceae bacterium]|nr:hypothetical protein [Planctomycetaceae bacterium]
MTLRFAVVHEAEADFSTAVELADRVLLDTFSYWLDEESLPFQREWIAESAEGWRLTWKGVKKLADEAGVRAYGHFDGEPGEADAKAARRAILYLLASIPSLDGILFIRDQDDQPERWDGLDQARHQYLDGIPIVVGLAVVEREAWVICGFDPQDDNETVLIEAERQKLGFDPRHRSHELTAGKDDQAPRSPKRVLRQFSGDNWHRERHCWTNTPLEVLRERGGENGLTDFLDEIRDRIARLIGHVPEG